jgi:hypothetical protein
MQDLIEPVEDHSVVRYGVQFDRDFRSEQRFASNDRRDDDIGLRAEVELRRTARASDEPATLLRDAGALDANPRP